MTAVRTDWTKEEIAEIYHSPLLELIHKAGRVFREYQKARDVQLCTLLSIKTGGCAENCAYCPQSAHYKTGVKATRLVDLDTVLNAAKKAKEGGSTRFCMGAAWRQARDSKDFERVLEMVSAVNAMGLEVCCTLGMLTEAQAKKLKEAGLHAYNHNLDTSENFYPSIITTRTYQERLDTLQHVRDAGITVCCGGILGMGETDQDRIDLLHTLATQEKHPESVPINALIPIKGTPLEQQKRLSIWEMVRMVATARIVMPEAKVRLSAGREQMSDLEQAFCFLAGANSIHTGEKLLTTPNPGEDRDKNLLDLLGLIPEESLC